MSSPDLRGIDIVALVMLRGWLGHGEVGGNNRGSFVAAVTQGRYGAWCAALQWTALDCACSMAGERNPIPYSRNVHVARRLLEFYIDAGVEVAPEDAQPGDYLCVARGLPWQGHAMRISGGLWPHFDVICGNRGSYKLTRGKVAERPIDIRELDVVGIGRLG